MPLLQRKVVKKINMKKRKIFLLKQFFYSRQFPVLHGYPENAKQHQFNNFRSPRSPCLAVRKTTFKEHGQNPNHYDRSEFAEVQIDLLKKPFKDNVYTCERKVMKNLRYNLLWFGFFSHIYFFSQLVTNFYLSCSASPASFKFAPALPFHLLQNASSPFYWDPIFCLKTSQVKRVQMPVYLKY